MSGGDNVTITIQDGGANTTIEVPAANIRVVMGCLLSSTASWAASGANPTAVTNQIVSATQASTLAPYFVGGKLLEAAGLDCAGGATVLAIGIPVVTTGTATAVQATVPGGSSSTITLTLDPTNGAWDDYYIKILCTTAGTVGTAGIFFQVSLDAGRNYGSPIALGTQTTYKIPNTGVQINFGAGTLALNDYWQASTTGPKGNTAGYNAALTALQTSQYALAGWGGIHLTDVVSGATASTIQGYLGGSPDGSGGLASNYVYTRMIVDTVDAVAPTAWGGTGQTEAAWMSALETSYSATTAVRVCASAGYYNMPSAYPNAAAGTPAYRRCLGWALDQREAVIPPQRHAGRVSDGALGAIVVNPTTDPTDGFVYHDERITTPGLTTARFAAAKTRVGKQGFFIDQPNLMCSTGSVYNILPRGNVIDIGCFVVFQSAQEEIDEDLRLLPNGTLYPPDRLSAQNQILTAVNTNMTNVGMLSPGSTVTIDPNANVGATGNVPITVSLVGVGYVLNETISIGFAAPNAAGG
jgi:hypothetical protein